LKFRTLINCLPRKIFLDNFFLILGDEEEQYSTMQPTKLTTNNCSSTCLLEKEGQQRNGFSKGQRKKSIGIGSGGYLKFKKFLKAKKKFLKILKKFSEIFKP